MYECCNSQWKICTCFLDFPFFVQFPAVSERSFSSQQRAGTQVEGEALEVQQFIRFLLPLLFFMNRVNSILCFVCLFVCFGVCVCVLSQPTHGGPRRVLFRPQPDVLFLTLQEDLAAATPSPPDTEDEEQDEENLNYTRRKPDRRIGRIDRAGLR